MPVSYTHLDVYKRQGQVSVSPEISRSLLDVRVLGPCGVRQRLIFSGVYFPVEVPEVISS